MQLEQIKRRDWLRPRGIRLHYMKQKSHVARQWAPVPCAYAINVQQWTWGGAAGGQTRSQSRDSGDLCRVDRTGGPASKKITNNTTVKKDTVVTSKITSERLPSPAPRATAPVRPPRACPASRAGCRWSEPERASLCVWDACAVHVVCICALCDGREGGMEGKGW